MTKEDIWPEFIVAIVIFFILIAMLIVGVLIDKKHDNRLWNQGRCPECGSEWEYEQAVGHRYSTHYIYVCNECGKRIEIGELR